MHAQEVLRAIADVRRLFAELDVSRDLQPVAYWEAFMAIEDALDAARSLQETKEAEEEAYTLEMLAGKLRK